MRVNVAELEGQSASLEPGSIRRCRPRASSSREDLDSGHRSLQLVRLEFHFLRLCPWLSSGIFTLFGLTALSHKFRDLHILKSDFSLFWTFSLVITVQRYTADEDHKGLRQVGVVTRTLANT